jgi:hypothetical protein
MLQYQSQAAVSITCYSIIQMRQYQSHALLYCKSHGTVSVICTISAKCYLFITCYCVSQRGTVSVTRFIWICTKTMRFCMPCPCILPACMIRPHTIPPTFCTSVYNSSWKCWGVQNTPLPDQYVPLGFIPKWKGWVSNFSYLISFDSNHQKLWETKRHTWPCIWSVQLDRTQLTHGWVGRLPWPNLTLNIATLTFPTRPWVVEFWCVLNGKKNDRVRRIGKFRENLAHFPWQHVFSEDRISPFFREEERTGM